VCARGPHYRHSSSAERFHLSSRTLFRAHTRNTFVSALQNICSQRALYNQKHAWQCASSWFAHSSSRQVTRQGFHALHPSLDGHLQDLNLGCSLWHLVGLAGHARPRPPVHLACHTSLSPPRRHLQNASICEFVAILSSLAQGLILELVLILPTFMSVLCWFWPRLSSPTLEIGQAVLQLIHVCSSGHHHLAVFAHASPRSSPHPASRPRTHTCRCLADSSPQSPPQLARR